MRIHALEITGFGPFKGTEKIDFDALTADHLFMLEGPTGAGKSSIIDAIVWVLYGQTAHQAARKVNDDKEVKEFAARIHSDFIEPGDETRVVMEFSVNAARYRVQRTLAFKPKTKASPELKAATTSRLEFIKPTAEAITKDIHFEIYRILQMEVTQFSQLVVLPQAAFDTFLRAKSEARGEVLEKIFKTNFYTDLENYLQNRGREIKAEFEAEGTRTDELLRLLDVTRTCNIPLTLKIGGCEAVKDLYEARQFGARYIVAPMIESEYALRKFCDTIHKVYPTEEAQEVDFLFNLETIQAYNFFDDIIQVAIKSPIIAGVVFGRTDFSGHERRRSQRESYRVHRGDCPQAGAHRTRFGGGRSYFDRLAA